MMAGHRGATDEDNPGLLTIVARAPPQERIREHLIYCRVVVAAYAGIQKVMPRIRMPARGPRPE
ncbi:MAG: hypothetical protein FD165_1720 [Gammaproteobacteria bacterium]|nr:MAG: hypothetical protein FD165_1720 [Gammaproteobacteria bacterium]TND04291.1 MAG: hypothetical protein FD120_1405 [Gammaproteobacteria bacterium]